MPDGTHWFPAADLCRNLGYSHTGSALRAIADASNYEALETVLQRHTLGIPAGREWRRDMKLVNLQGLVRLVNACTKPEAEPFKAWASKVLVAVQRDGSYALTKAEVQPTGPGAPVAYAMPQQVADAIVRLEEQNIRNDERLAAAQEDANKARWEGVEVLKAVADAQQKSVIAMQEVVLETMRSMARVAESLDALAAHRSPPGPPAETLTADTLLAAWRARLTITDDVWAVAVLLAPALAERGEVWYSAEHIAARTGLTTARVHDSLRFLLKRQCIRQVASLHNTPGYGPHRA
ncbi:BRO-N domain-containing protein [Streptomyces hainanensis]|uniref:DNA-binding protein n=1 Tax=Streptomyces hainanensis TaxID=402648 RepID=A0A4R4TQ23_9ACTN|nr:Bro-N domain-containing protein [Streptomyces hainanensis]TDC76219.1 DNA-binding protein [Streptomyces hainanensis]